MLDILFYLTLTPWVPATGVAYLIIKYFKYSLIPVPAWGEVSMGWIALKYLNWFIYLLLSLFAQDSFPTLKYLDYSGLYAYTYSFYLQLKPHLANPLSILALLPFLLSVLYAFISEPLTDLYLILFYIYHPSVVTLPDTTSKVLIWANAIAWAIKGSIVVLMSMMSGEWDQAIIGSLLINAKIFVDSLYPTLWYTKMI